MVKFSLACLRGVMRGGNVKRRRCQIIASSTTAAIRDSRHCALSLPRKNLHHRKQNRRWLALLMSPTTATCRQNCYFGKAHELQQWLTHWHIGCVLIAGSPPNSFARPTSGRRRGLFFLKGTVSPHYHKLRTRANPIRVSRRSQPGRSARSQSHLEVTSLLIKVIFVPGKFNELVKGVVDVDWDGRISEKCFTKNPGDSRFCKGKRVQWRAVKVQAQMVRFGGRFRHFSEISRYY